MPHLFFLLGLSLGTLNIRRGGLLHIPPSTRGIKYAARKGIVKIMCTTVEIPNMATKAYPAVADGVYG